MFKFTRKQLGSTEGKHRPLRTVNNRKDKPKSVGFNKALEICFGILLVGVLVAGFLAYPQALEPVQKVHAIAVGVFLLFVALGFTLGARGETKNNKQALIGAAAFCGLFGAALILFALFGPTAAHALEISTQTSRPASSVNLLAVLAISLIVLLVTTTLWFGLHYKDCYICAEHLRNGDDDIINEGKYTCRECKKKVCGLHSSPYPKSEDRTCDSCATK